MNNNGHRPDHHDQRALVCRGIRGAISVEENTKAAIVARTAELLRAIVEANGVRQEDIVSVFFSATPDLDAEYPAIAARRELGWHDVGLMCGQEMVVPGSLRMCIRVLIHWNTTLRNSEIRHIYLREAVTLRPDHSDKQKTLEPPFKS
ncbi:MAG: chorismate mutase [Anaerolineae bacterium]|nr:chorismate mutase [Anaerolineae bacterium]